MYDLQGHVGVITGSSRGIGAATAIAMAKAGAKVVVNYLKNEKAANSVVKTIVDAGGDAIAVQADVSKPDDVKRLMGVGRNEFGFIDILINNAYCFPIEDKSFMETTWEEYETQFLGVVGSSFFCTKELLPDMKKRKWGRIVNVSSTTIRQPEFGFHARATAKSALTSFTMQLAQELMPCNITVNVIAPGWTDTDQVAKFMAMKHSAASKTPGGKIARPEEVADVILALVSPETRILTGATIPACQGYIMG